MEINEHLKWLEELCDIKYVICFSCWFLQSICEKVWFNVPTSDDKAILNNVYNEVVMQILLSSDCTNGFQDMYIVQCTSPWEIFQLCYMSQNQELCVHPEMEFGLLFSLLKEVGEWINLLLAHNKRPHSQRSTCLQF